MGWGDSGQRTTENQGGGLTTNQVNALIVKYFTDNPPAASGIWTPTVSALKVAGIASGSPQGTLTPSSFGWVGDKKRKVFQGHLTWTPPENNAARITGIEAVLTLPTGFRITDFYGQVFWNYVEHNQQRAFYGDNQGAGNLFVASDNKNAPFTKILLDTEFDNAFATPYQRTGIVQGWLATEAS